GAQGAARLDDYHADVMADDVMELACDPLAFLERRPACPFLSFPIEQAGAFLQRLRVEAADPGGVADQPGDDEDHLGLDGALERHRKAAAPDEDDTDDHPGEHSERHRDLAFEPFA